jgi:hypothetical protein
MGFFNNLLDNFKSKDFHISPNMKVATAQKQFKANFRLSLRVYKGNQFADGDQTFAALNKRTSAKIKSSSDDISIKSSMTVKEFENVIKDHYGLKVQVADEFNRYLINDKYTLGQASRRQHLIDHLKSKGYDSIEDFLEKHNCKTLEEYYSKN